MVLRLLATSLLILFFESGTVLAQAPARPSTPPPQAAAAPQPQKSGSAGAVGIVTGDVESTGIRMASDLARLLDSDADLRIIPIAGKSSVQNISDLLSLRAIDAAIVQSDVLSYFLKTGRQPNVQTRMLYVAKLHSEEFHVLARMQFTCLQDLNERRVSFGPRESGSAITAEAVFEAAGIRPDVLYLEHEDAIEKLKKGEIDALVSVSGKPSRAFDRISHRDRVHFLDVEYSSNLQQSYLPAIITKDDYPELVAPNESVATIGVSTVLFVHNWHPQSERFRNVSRFAEKFLTNFETLKGGTFNPKWREVNIRAPLKGWTRFQPAERWLVANAAAKAQTVTSPQAAAQLKTMLQKFVESQRGSGADEEELFNQFVRWYQQQGTQPTPPRQQ
ncbi:TAXI family TRAP transporter solute-binding subunit [Rhodomicrobium lacus]|uniref:TAXI family TRAP transporter solute-binding subunit n=1 Tax=Rhodomicrobium lacus TaxID=2498452 RepID=UPI0026E48FE8|nr:TAXI family TRAP transporter solute-binding subunit [Rhodomicrobium lacus]WKW51695.1 TAXI family TRAP transporter solute-binding subunit [Rhodomicrobium lacus]